jgi:hypothetical protein
LGVYVTLTVQFAPAARLVPQVFVSENSLGSVVIPIPPAGMVSAAVPVLVNVTICAASG